MEAITLRLQKLEKIEASLYAELHAASEQRHEENRALRGIREQEDREWRQRIGLRDREEDVSKRTEMGLLDGCSNVSLRTSANVVEKLLERS